MSRSQDPQLHVELLRDEPCQPNDDGLLAAFCFKDDGDFQSNSNRVGLCLPPIEGGRLIESWRTPHPVSFRRTGRVRISESKHYSFAIIQLQEQDHADFQSLVFEAYSELLSAVSSTACPHIVKIWNYFDRINDEEEGLERYQQFSWARADAFRKTGSQ